ncbi:fructokinase [Palleronia aestuarii]|uniref:Fructokinase n=1 Tax=Palleronia aestuarii TaxID=568105 RepID=A0A2W7NHS1_9RHOB|nr:carbohydrate kinase [Palleronia aestuarii]PZX17777.1 fructokinase [Palleronia aestuarii]
MILCCGEALIDMLPQTGVGGDATFAPHVGGSVFNTAIALARLGAPTGFFTGLSTDLFGQMLERALADDGVETRFARRSDRPTTLAFVTLTNGQAQYAFYDENTAARMLEPDDLPETDAADALFFGGISLMVEPCATAYEALAARDAPGKVMMLDPNIRASFITDETAYRERIGHMLGLADIVKLSDEDLRWLKGAGDLAALAEEVLDAGPRLVCITEGAHGVTGYMPGGRAVRVPAHTVEVVDTVGAGDTFNAGLLASLARQGMLKKDAIGALDAETVGRAIALGAEAAAVTVSRAGANPPYARELT